jgi:LmbE family N-acetylglucosaminyl deacetylase
MPRRSWAACWRGPGSDRVIDVTALVIAPHPDDEAIGCGGVMVRRAERGERVHVTFLTSGERGLASLEREDAWRVREAEAAEAAAVLGVTSTSFLRIPDGRLKQHAPAATEQLTDVIERHAPDVVYAPHPDERHPDHSAAWSITLAAATRCEPPVETLLRYEVWTPLTTFDLVEVVTAAMPRKLEAIRCYRSQLREFDYVQAATGLAHYRGALAAKTEYAEVFQSFSEDGLAG